jgi:hypothetical protein
MRLKQYNIDAQPAYAVPGLPYNVAALFFVGIPY